MIRRPPRSTLFPSTPPLPICTGERVARPRLLAGRHHVDVPVERDAPAAVAGRDGLCADQLGPRRLLRSEEHTSELQSRQYLVCRLLLEKKNKYTTQYTA